MLASGCAFHVEVIHGETILILSGPQAGMTFTAVKETESDVLLNTELSEDPRPRRMVRFRDGFAPNITSQERVKTEDGKIWVAVRNPGDGFLTQDFELKEVTTFDTP